MAMLFPQVFVGMFTPDPELTAYAVPAVRIYMAASLLFGVQLSCQQTFVALGNAKSSLFLAVLRKLILLIPLIYLLPAILPDKVSAVFLAEPVADVLAVTTTAILFSVQFTRTLKRMRGEKAPQ
jgi:Na+-driven multidrug efflux pump